MSSGSFTFRCGECNRLLGVSRSRVGQSITCPKCGTEQPVPNPDPLIDSGTPSGMIVTPPAPATTPVGAGTAAPLAVPLPEVEPAFAGLQLDPEPLSIRPTEPSRSRTARRPEVPSNSGETATARTSGTMAVSPDLILPRAVVRFWTLASLLGTIGAFVAGLLTGHFLWR
jgi:DNA-directed RNA polymerase subunit RPC12/RpoP